MSVSYQHIGKSESLTYFSKVTCHHMMSFYCMLWVTYVTTWCLSTACFGQHMLSHHIFLQPAKAGKICHPDVCYLCVLSETYVTPKNMSPRCVLSLCYQRLMSPPKICHPDVCYLCVLSETYVTQKICHPDVCYLCVLSETYVTQKFSIRISRVYYIESAKFSMTSLEIKAKKGLYSPGFERHGCSFYEVCMMSWSNSGHFVANFGTNMIECASGIILPTLEKFLW